MADTLPPVVSLIVRSSARASLQAALDSIGLQDYPCLEVIVVAASGRDHPALPDRRGGHPLRLVKSEVRLSRPQAANAGLDAARGDWITFLDDDDLLLPGHVAGLVAAQRNARGARLIYTLALGRFADGHTESWGKPYALSELYERNFIHLSTALFAQSLVADGCRFDEAFEIMQDWDFFLQCAQHTNFHFEPRQTFEWHVDLGSSGTGVGGNEDAARFARFRDAIYAKWSGPRNALAARVKQLLEDAAASLRGRDFASAEARCREALAASPGDPWALNTLALACRARGRLADAELAQAQAVAVRPNNPTLLYNLAEIHRERGDLVRARGCLQRALELAPDFASAQTLLATLDAQRA
ncbi:MAG: tetratricopeptide repeat protein [Betaproteobacteria bacterium]